MRPRSAPFSADGGLKLMSGNLGRAVIKTSAVQAEHLVIEAPALVFDDQDELLAAFKAGELERDFVAVVRFQGPRANGMPELHKLTPRSPSLQDAASRWHWSPTGACRGLGPGACRNSRDAPSRMPAEPSHVCATGYDSV